MALSDVCLTMTALTPTLRETFGRWEFTYFIVSPKYLHGPFHASALVHEGGQEMAHFVLSRPEAADEMVRRLRGYCEEWARDREDPERVTLRQRRTIGDCIKAGQAGEKGVR